MESGGRVVRLLGLDVGDKFVGVAMTDGLGVMVQPVLTMRRGRLKDDVKSVARLVRRFEIAEIVVGLPLHLSGEVGKQALRATEFADAVREGVGVPVVLFDERLTTREAHTRLDAAGFGTKDRKSVLDQVAAVILLESYLAEKVYREARESRSRELDGE